MTPSRVAFASAVLACGLIAAASAATKLEILETDPASPAALGKWENFSLHVACRSDAPVRLRGRTYLGATEVLGPQRGMPSCGPGSTDALLWFSHVDAARVDRVVVQAAEESGAPIGPQAALAVDVQWSGVQPSSQRSAPDWLARLRADEKARQDAAYKAYMNRSWPPWTNLLLFALVLGVPGYFILQVLALTRLRGGWRLAAALPLLPMTAVVLYTIYAYSRGSNLFPLVLIFTGLPAAIYLSALLFLYPATS